MNKGGRRRRRVRRRIRSPISGGSSSAAFLFPCLHLDSGDHNESSVDVRREVSSEREEELSGGTSLGPVAKRWNGQAYPPIGFKIDIPFVGRPTAISRKNRGRLWRAFLPPSPSLAPPSPFPSPFRLFQLVLPLSLFPPSMANDSCCDRCQDASLPRAITQWPPLFLRGYRTDRRERRSSGNYGLSRCALDNRPEDVRGYTQLSRHVASRFRRATIFRFWRGLERPSETER